MSDLITPKIAADLLALSPKTIYKLIARGVIRGLKIGRSVRVVLDSLNELFAETKKPAPEEPARVAKGKEKEAKPRPSSRGQKRGERKGYRHVPKRS